MISPPGSSYPFGGFKIREERSATDSLKRTGWKPVVSIQ